MKTFLNYLFVLCPSIVIYGCSNDDKDMVICPYPSFECENAKGDLIYRKFILRLMVKLLFLQWKTTALMFGDRYRLNWPLRSREMEMAASSCSV